MRCKTSSRCSRRRTSGSRCSSPITANARALGASVVLAVGLTACAAGETTEPRRIIGSPIERAEDITTPPPREPVEPLLAIGDSILVGARDFGELPARLSNAGWIPEIVAEVGKTINWALPLIEQRDEVPRTVVVVLGSNPGPALGDFPAEVDALVEALRARGARRIVWIPPAHADPARYAERVDALEAARRIEVPPWTALIGNDPGLVGNDGLHLTGDGYQLLAAFITATVGSPDV